MFTITRGRKMKAQKVVLYGPEGIGKSTFLSKFPNVVFCDTEGSTDGMDVARLPAPTSWEMLLDEVRFVAKGGLPECRTFALDTADWAERACAEHICHKHKKDSIESFGYGNGYTYLSEEFGRLLNLLTEVRDKGINVVIAAHAQLVKFEQPDELGAYDRWELKLGLKKTEKRTAQLIKEWADALLFVNYETIVVKSETNKNKAQGGKRVMYTAHTPTWDAKNRWGLPDKVEFDYSVIAPFIPILGESEMQAKSATQKVQEPITEAAVSVPAEMPVDKEGNGYLFAEEGEPPERKVKARPAVPIPDGGNKPFGEAVEEMAPEFGEMELDPDLPQGLRDLMNIHKVSEAEIRKAVAFRGFYPEDMSVTSYDPAFIEGVLIAAWSQVYDVIKRMRN